MAPRRQAAARARVTNRVLRRPASTQSRSAAASSSRRSNSDAVERPRLRARTSAPPAVAVPCGSFTCVVAVDANVQESGGYHVFMDFKNGGLLTLGTHGRNLKCKERGGHFVYQLVFKETSDDERACPGVDGTIHGVNVIGWLSRSQFLQLARDRGSSATRLVEDE